MIPACSATAGECGGTARRDRAAGPETGVPLVWRARCRGEPAVAGVPGGDGRLLAGRAGGGAGGGVVLAGLAAGAAARVVAGLSGGSPSSPTNTPHQLSRPSNPTSAAACGTTTSDPTKPRPRQHAATTPPAAVNTPGHRQQHDLSPAPKAHEPQAPTRRRPPGAQPAGQRTR